MSGPRPVVQPPLLMKPIPVGGVRMITPPVTAGKELTAAEISTLLAEKFINRLPIYDTKDRPVDIVTRTDLISALCV